MSAKRVSSRDNALYKTLVRLGSSTRVRRSSGRTLIEGEHLIEAWRDAKLGEAELNVAAESTLELPALRELFESTPARTRAVLADRLLAQLSQVVSSAGLIAVIRTPEPLPVPESVGDAVLLEGVQDPGNLGSLLRSALGAGITDVFLSPGTVAAWSPKVVRAGMGAHFGLRIRENADVASVARRAIGLIVATQADAAGNLYETDLRRPVLWLFGNEGAGLSRAAAAAASHRVHIPMPGRLESLNVAAAAAVCLFEQVRQRASRRAAPA